MLTQVGQVAAFQVGWVGLVNLQVGRISLTTTSGVDRVGQIVDGVSLSTPSWVGEVGWVDFTTWVGWPGRPRVQHKPKSLIHCMLGDLPSLVKSTLKA